MKNELDQQKAIFWKNQKCQYIKWESLTMGGKIQVQIKGEFIEVDISELSNHREIKREEPITNQVFEVGNIYEMFYIGDSDLRPQYICTARTEKMVTLERFKNANDQIKRRIKLDSDNNEYIVDGNYSMAPTVNSKKVVG